MSILTIAPRRKFECKMAFQVERRPHFLMVAIQGQASFDQAEVLEARLLRIPREGYSLVVLDLAELTFLSSLAMGALVAYRQGLSRRGIEVRLANVQAATPRRRTKSRYERVPPGKCQGGWPVASRVHRVA